MSSRTPSLMCMYYVLIVAKLLYLLKRMNECVQLQLKFNVIGTSESTLSTSSLSIHTARLSASTTVIQSGPVTVKLPHHIASDRSPGSVRSGAGVGKTSVADVADCYEATVVLAKESPYIYGLADAGKVTVLCNL